MLERKVVRKDTGGIVRRSTLLKPTGGVSPFTTLQFYFHKCLPDCKIMHSGYLEIITINIKM